jgi:hypothetical protein
MDSRNIRLVISLGSRTRTRSLNIGTPTHSISRCEAQRTQVNIEFLSNLRKAWVFACLTGIRFEVEPSDGAEDRAEGV